MTAFEEEGMACIGTALETGYGRIPACKHVNYLSFAFISPLKAEDYV